jgi:tRNA-dihydrouridine synthase
MIDKQPYLYLAPIRGLTDALFRETFYEHFSGFDAAIAPFINPQKKALYSDKMLVDLLPENNGGRPLVPQLLHTNPQDFLTLANRLTKLGYTHINWNLGCPAPMVTRKKRGSGLLPHPEMILDILSTITKDLDIELSIKTRLGFYDTSELKTLLPELHHFRLKEIIIHARLGKQLYKGTTDRDGFAACQPLTNHTLVYNGDINDIESFTMLALRFPTVQRWMLGRGGIGNPFLAETIKGHPLQSEAKRKERLLAFHEHLYRRYQKRLAGPGHLLGRFKHLWLYLIASFPGQEKRLKKILKCRSPQNYLKAVDQLFHAKNK